MTRFEAFCNITTDLQAICDIDSYDRKRVLPGNFVASGTTNLYYLHNSGFVSQLYMDGAEQTYVSDTPNAMNEWTYQAASDRLDVYIGGSSVADMNARNWEESQDFARTYDFILIRINAILAAADLVRRVDTEKGQEIYEMALNADGTGLLDRLKRGEFALWNETTNKSEDGIVNVVSIDSSTTGFPQDIKLHGPPSVDYDEARLVISTGGTFAPGTSSPVKYDVYVKNDLGLRMDKVVDAETMNGSYQAFAYGAHVLWSPGIYVVGDEFSVTFQSSDIQIGAIKSGQLYR